MKSLKKIALTTVTIIIFGFMLRLCAAGFNSSSDIGMVFGIALFPISLWGFFAAVGKIFKKDWEKFTKSLEED